MDAGTSSEQLLLLGQILFIAGLVMGLVKVARDAGLPTRYAPAAAVFLGIAISLPIALVLNGPSALALVAGLLTGIATGLQASGYWSAGQTTLKG